MLKYFFFLKKLLLVKKQVYCIRFHEKSSTWKSENVSDNTQFVLTHLQPETEYEFLIEPFNDLGKGFSSPIIFAKTKGLKLYSKLEAKT